MAGKFKIFCDDCPRSTFEPEDKPMALSQPTQQQQQQSSIQQQQTNLRQTNEQHSNNTTASGLISNKLTAANEQEKFIALNQEPPVLAPQAGGGGGGGGGGLKLQVHQKREPLGLRQPLTQASVSSLTTTTTTAAAAAAVLLETRTNSSSSSAISINEEDQENDISMASLGSDFVPSILQDDEEDDEFGDHSFEVEEEEELEEGISIRGGALVDDDDDFSDDDFEDDPELQMELSQAFKQHDESQLFKSVVYIDDIQSYLHGLEREIELRPLPNYMDFQRELDSDKRAILINWLVEVSDEYNLQTETLFICTGVIDRFLSKMVIPTSNFQLLGVAAMFIASKYEEIYPPNLYQFVEVTDDTYSGHQIRQMEQEILKSLNFRISLPTISYFLRQIFAFNKFSKKVYHLAEYLCYLSLLDDQPFLEYYPSEIALAAVILAANQLDAASSISSDLKSAYDKSNLDQLQRRNLPKDTKLRDIERRAYIIDKELPFCIESLRTLQQRAFSRSSPMNADMAIVHKFSSDSHSQVALLQPPKLEDLFMY